jgi:hypothetical protein
MYGIVGPVSGCYQVIDVQNELCAVSNVVNGHWIHVVNKQLTVDLVAFYAEITAIVAHDYVFSDLFPLSGSVELLVEIPIEAESRDADIAFEGEIVESLFKGRKSS